MSQFIHVPGEVPEQQYDTGLQDKMNNRSKLCLNFEDRAQAADMYCPEGQVVLQSVHDEAVPSEYLPLGHMLQPYFPSPLMLANASKWLSQVP